MRIPVETKPIAIDCLIRGYTYTAHLSLANGRLLRITAGCREWKTFTEAFVHYDTGKWSELAIGENCILFAYRMEARRVLDRLMSKVSEHQTKLREAAKLKREHKK